MFKLTDEKIVVYPWMTLMHPDDYSKIDTTDFDVFYEIYIRTDTGMQIFPETKFPVYPKIDEDGYVTNYVAKPPSDKPWEHCPNWLQPRSPGGLSMNALRNLGLLRALTPRYDNKLSREALWKVSHALNGHPELAIGVSLPGTVTPTIGLFYCNNQTSTGSVYRTGNDDEIFIFNHSPASEDALPTEFDDKYFELNFELSKRPAVIEPGTYVLAPTQTTPLADEPPLPLTLSKRYNAYAVINSDRWLAGIYLIKTQEQPNEHI